MNKRQRTSIENLAVAGSELSEEHLSLASGGTRFTAQRDVTYLDNGMGCKMDTLYCPD